MDTMCAEMSARDGGVVSPGVKSILAELREQLDRLYGDRLERLVLFGSQARGDAEPDSDIDVLVVLRGEVSPGEEIERTSETRGAICLKHAAVISCVYVSADRYATAQDSLLRNVRREGIPA